MSYLAIRLMLFKLFVFPSETITKVIKQCNSSLCGKCLPHYGPGGAVLKAFLGWEFVPVPPCRACVPLKKPEGLSLARERGSRCLQVLGRLRMMLSPPFRIPTWTWTRPCRCTALGAGSRSRTVCHQQGELRIWVGPRDSPAPL